MNYVVKILLLILLSSAAHGGTIQISLNKNLEGERIIKTRVYGEIPDLGVKTTELILPGTANGNSSGDVCNQFLIPEIEKSVLFPKPLNSTCTIRAFTMSAFQCPGGPMATTIIVEGSNCEETIELFKSSDIHLTGTLLPESGPDISGVDFFLR